MPRPPWPHSLFGRLLAATVGAVLLAEAAGLFLIAQERERFVLQGSVREWTRRIAETAQMLQPLGAAERSAAVSRLMAPPDAAPPAQHTPGMASMAHGHLPGNITRSFVHLPLLSDFERTLKEQVRAALGPGYAVEVSITPEPPPPAIAVPVPFFEARELAAHQGSAEHYDVDVRLPDGAPLVFRVTRMPQGAPLPRHLFGNLALLLLALVGVLYLAARNITRPLSELARAANSIGRNGRPTQLEERGARELRDAARAFNTMQDRLRRYLDSRTRVLAAMSHDLKTPLTRLRLQVETLDDSSLQQRIGRQLDEMEAMVREGLALFRGVEDAEPATPIDLNALLAQVCQEFTDTGAQVTLSGRVAQPLAGKPQALKRCLTNLVSNAVIFGTSADILVEDGPRVTIRVRDHGPGVPETELERVFEPFYRLEASRNRDSGGSGLGLSIARDVAQMHGGSLILNNLPGGGLEAVMCLPRQR